MDDLFQSLVSTGHGTTTQTRPEATPSVAQGVAFGAAFDATLMDDADDAPLALGESALLIDDGDGEFARVASERPLTLPTHDGADLRPSPLAEAPVPTSPTSLAITAQFAETDGPLGTAQITAGNGPATAAAAMQASSRVLTSTAPLTTPVSPPVTLREDGQIPLTTPPARHQVAEGPLVLPTAQSMDRAPHTGPLVLPNEPAQTAAISPASNPRVAQELPLTTPIARGTAEHPLTTPVSEARPTGGSHPLTLPVADDATWRANPDTVTRTTVGRDGALTSPTAPDGLAREMPKVLLTAGAAEGSLASQRKTNDAVPSPQFSAPSTAAPRDTAQPLPHPMPQMAATAAAVDPSRQGAPTQSVAPRPPQSVMEDRPTEPTQRDAPLRTGGWTIPAAPATAPFVTVSAPPLPTALTPTELVVDALPELDFALTVGSSSISTTALTPTTSLLAHAPSATAQTIAQQISAALNAAATDADTPLELALDPPELGRVRMQMVEISGVMTLTILAERPETADLMRRHLDLLAQEFAQAGLDAPSVQISQDGAEGQGGDAREQTHASAATPDDADLPAIATQRTASGGLDLRL